LKNYNKAQQVTAAKPNQGGFADKKGIPNLALLLTRDKETVFNSLSVLSGKRCRQCCDF